MAQKKQDRRVEKRPEKRYVKDGKPGIGARFKRFFSSIRSEIKKVVWPDREKLVQSTATVLMIILAAAVILWAFDSIINLVLTNVGFYTPAAVETAPAVAGSLPVIGG
ncbi:MAG TPA: preprotein translocase subunit SecE [Fastidiosipila sp.]|jgi:preprotein translocase SecE subunit|nr:preprotein translocase subunit SecE [Fastidiosipila sp.]